MGTDDDDHHRAAVGVDRHDARKPPLLFYKLMVASIVQDNKLKIPGKVVKRIEQELSIVVTISVPDGKKWNVKLGKDGGKCWFGDGWVEFMKYYSVKVGYLLVFRYKGDSTFVVNIFNLSNAEIQYLPDDHVGGSERGRPEKQCSASKGNQCGNGDTEKTFDSLGVKEEKSCLLAKGKKSENECNKKLDSAQVSEHKLCPETNGKEPGNDGTQKMLYSAPQGLATVASQSQKISGVIIGLLSSKFNELRTEVLPNIKYDMGGSEEVQLGKQSSLNESDKLENDSTMKRAVPKMIRQDKHCSVNKCKESGNNAIQKKSGSKTTQKDNLCSVTSHAEPRSDDTLKKSDLPPPGFGEPSQQTPGTGCFLSPQSDRVGSSLGGVEKEMKPSGEAGSPSSFLFVKDVSPGYYRANIMSLKKTKQPKIRKTKNSQPTDPGFGAEKVKLNSLGKKELTPEIHLSKMASSVPTGNSLTTAAKSEGSVISHMRTIALGGDKKLPQLSKMYSETQPPMNIPPANQLNVYTPVKRKEEIYTTDLIDNTTPLTVSAGQRVDVSTGGVLNCTSEKIAKVQKKQKTIQLSAISNPPVNPYCMVTMRASYVQKKSPLNIPANFASKYLQEASGDATLQNLEGEQWKVRLISSTGSSKLSQGWHRFATDNYLKAGDMCIFELLNSVNTLFKVSFIRSPKDPPPADREVLKL